MNNFYKLFEDRYRGSFAMIKGRLAVYHPFVQAIANFYPGVKILDIGCGRGEWLTLLREQHIPAYGIDLDDGMLAACKEMDLEVACDDACHHLKQLPDESLIVVSAFHVAEHLSFEQLQTLVTEAIRVLKPGGLLILETPNTENIVVATTGFHLDPTHVKPIPPQLLMFLTEHCGYKKNKLLRLNESQSEADGVSLRHVLNGVSPDYAVIGQKNAGADILAQTDALFEKEYGVTLETVVERYDNVVSSMKQDLFQLEQQLLKITLPYRTIKKWLGHIKQFIQRGLKSQV
jgi:ubiquinone/menaquinone biosynthesis C-methylase UbiE